MAVTVVRTDAADLRLPRRPFRVVANPPFGITTALLSRLLAPGSRVVRADLIVPVHVAHRWASERAPKRGRWGAHFHIAVGRRLPPSAFRPPGPPSAVLVLTAREQPG
jgi:23S rRNA (adenine-N6)-dimethyltransferase